MIKQSHGKKTLIRTASSKSVQRKTCQSTRLPVLDSQNVVRHFQSFDVRHAKAFTRENREKNVRFDAMAGKWNLVFE